MKDIRIKEERLSEINERLNKGLYNQGSLTKLVNTKYKLESELKSKSPLIKTDAGTEYQFHRTDNDLNGNPRYIISWLSLGLKEYKSTKLTRRAGLRIYRGKSFGGGFVIQSHDLKRTAEFLESLNLKS